MFLIYSFLLLTHKVFAMKTLDMKGVIYVSENISPAKLKVLKMYNASLEFHGQDCIDTETQARHVAEVRAQMKHM